MSAWIHTKVCSDAEARHQFNWYDKAPKTCTPMHVAIREPVGISYDFVWGTTPTIAEAWRAAHQLWDADGLSPPIDVGAYIDYVNDISEDVSALLDDVLSRRSTILTRVSICHGDMTLQNCIRVKDASRRVVFIDPGHHRGLPCRELDEAKLMQSLEGFCTLYRGLRFDPSPLPFAPTRVHYALLASHYARLLKHVQHEAAQAFAQRRIREILEDLG